MMTGGQNKVNVFGVLLTTRDWVVCEFRIHCYYYMSFVNILFFGPSDKS
jgi:hypothetical protein